MLYRPQRLRKSLDCSERERLHIPLLTPLGRSLREFDVLENLLISSVVKVLARISGRNCVDTIAAALNELGTTLPAVVPRGSAEKDMRLG